MSLLGFFKKNDTIESPIPHKEINNADVFFENLNLLENSITDEEKKYINILSRLIHSSFYNDGYFNNSVAYSMLENANHFYNLMAFIEKMGIIKYDSASDKQKVLFTKEEFEEASKKAASKSICYKYYHFCSNNPNEIDLLDKAIQLAIKNLTLSTSLLQRKFSLGYARASSLLKNLQEIGVVESTQDCSQKKVIINQEQFNELKDFIKSREQTKEDSFNSDKSDYDKLEGLKFEEFCANILRKNMFEEVTVTQGSGDQGIDIIATKDSIIYGIQCKRYTSDIGNKAVQEAYSGKQYYDCHVAVVLTNSYFTKSAIELANKNKVILWDRDKLEELIESANIGIKFLKD